MELSFPIGDVGSGGLGTVGFFWADKDYGYILESRHDPLIIREAGVMGENDFLYANNSALHPDAGCAPWMQKDRANWRWDPHGGWYRVKLRTFSLASLFTVRDHEELIANAMGTAYLNSFGRNLFLFNQLNQEVGRIKLETMKKMYRRGGTLPPGSWKEIVASYKKMGKWGSLSSAHASNAMVAVMKPDYGNQGIYAYCVGSAARGLSPMNPISCCPIYNETNAFWELQLASSPEGVAIYARQKAQEYLHRACQKLAEIKQTETVYQPMNELLELAKHEFQLGQKTSNSVATSDENRGIYAWAKATRAFTRAQVRSLQVIHGLGFPDAQ